MRQVTHPVSPTKTEKKPEPPSPRSPSRSPSPSSPSPPPRKKHSLPTREELPSPQSRPRSPSLKPPMSIAHGRQAVAPTPTSPSPRRSPPSSPALHRSVRPSPAPSLSVSRREHSIPTEPSAFRDKGKARQEPQYDADGDVKMEDNGTPAPNFAAPIPTGPSRSPPKQPREFGREREHLRRRSRTPPTGPRIMRAGPGVGGPPVPPTSVTHPHPQPPPHTKYLPAVSTDFAGTRRGGRSTPTGPRSEMIFAQGHPSSASSPLVPSQHLNDVKTEHETGVKDEKPSVVLPTGPKSTATVKELLDGFPRWDTKLPDYYPSGKSRHQWAYEVCRLFRLNLLSLRLNDLSPIVDR